ncbi:hypothetical protein [Bordetella pertussis]|uniref:hypothetical protein n=1 Tax=Bordetella pertussis TaxID=520 RepID=UPI0002E57FB6|nr:hypothetical protein [Bordetella pertussis]ETH59932.1 hypothetical protein L553_3131 [Bordetella pertussis I036]
MNWGVGDFQFLKSGSDEPCIQPIESSHLDGQRSSRWSPGGGQVPMPGPLFIHMCEFYFMYVNSFK